MDLKNTRLSPNNCWEVAFCKNSFLLLAFLVYRAVVFFEIVVVY